MGRDGGGERGWEGGSDSERGEEIEWDGGEGVRQTVRGRERETDRQTDRQTHTQTDTQTHRQKTDTLLFPPMEPSQPQMYIRIDRETYL